MQDSTSIRFKWAPVDSATSYLFRFYHEAPALYDGEPTYYETTDTTYLISGLEYGWKYGCGVRAVNDSLVSEWESFHQIWFDLDTTIVPPSTEKVGIEFPDNPVSTTPILRWSNTHAKFYNIQVAKSTTGIIGGSKWEYGLEEDDFSDIVYYRSGIKDTFHLVRVTLEENVNYIWRVRSGWSVDVKSEWSGSSKFTPGQLPTSVDIEYIEPSVRIFPNPIQDDVTFEIALGKLDRVIVGIYDIHGVKIVDVYNGIMPEGIYTIRPPINGLSTGMYFVKFNIGNRVLVKKLVK